MGRLGVGGERRQTWNRPQPDLAMRDFPGQLTKLTEFRYTAVLYQTKEWRREKASGGHHMGVRPGMGLLKDAPATPVVPVGQARAPSGERAGGRGIRSLADLASGDLRGN